MRYSSGWCEQSFGSILGAVEILCRAKGDDVCRIHPGTTAAARASICGFQLYIHVTTLSSAPDIAPKPNTDLLAKLTDQQLLSLSICTEFSFYGLGAPTRTDGQLPFLWHDILLNDLKEVIVSLSKTTGNYSRI